MNENSSEKTEQSSTASPISSLQSRKSISSTTSAHNSHYDHSGRDISLQPVTSYPSIGHPISRPTTTIGSTRTNDPDFEVDWEEDDPNNPVNWPNWYKGLIIGGISWGTFVVVVYSTSYTTGISEMGNDFSVDSKPIVTLGVTSYCMYCVVVSLWMSSYCRGHKVC